MGNQSLPDPKTDMSAWYQEVIARAQLAEHAAVKGCMVIRPYGYAIWETIRSLLDMRIKARGVENACFPMLIPQTFLSREEAHVEGFSPECAVVTHAGGEALSEPLIVRPTSETIIHESMARWIQSHRDLPMRLNQWANVVRWEKRPRLFLRNTEFFWQEGHTAHATEQEARNEVQDMVDTYHDFVASVLAIPTVRGRKSEREKFAGAVESHSIEGLMPDGKGLQMGTVHYLGENFSRMANVGFLDQDGVRRFVHMTSWGVSTRLIGALIMVHGDERGLVLPPMVAPVQVIIVPIGLEKDREGVMSYVTSVERELKSLGVRVSVDSRDGKPGAKFYYHEMRGVPLRLEIGPRDVAAGSMLCVSRIGSGKSPLSRTDLVKIPELLAQIQGNMLERAEMRLTDRIIQVDNKHDLVRSLTEQEGFVSAAWCGGEQCELTVKQETSATIRNLPYAHGIPDASCVWCGGTSQFMAYFAKNY